MRNIYLGLSIICLIFYSYDTLYGDIIYFKNSERGIDVKINKMETDNVIVSVSKSDIFSVTMVFNSSSDFSDDLILINRVRVQCKVINMFDKDVVINFPRDSIRSVEMDFSKQSPRYGKSKYGEKTTTVGYGDRNKSSTQKRRDRFEQKPKKKDDLFSDFVTLEEDSDNDDFEKKRKRDRYKADNDVKNSLLSEIKTSKDNVKNQLLSEIKGLDSNKPSSSGGFDLLDKTLNKQAQLPPASNKREERKREPRSVSKTKQDINLGKVKGRFVSNGEPLESCKVRLVKLKKEGLTYYKDTGNSKQRETVTDRYGIYSFYNVNPGFYKLYWKPRSESSWIRKVSMEPDVVVEPGKIGYLDDIETNQRILN